MSLSSQMMGRRRGASLPSDDLTHRRRLMIGRKAKKIRDLNSFVSRLSRCYLAAQLSMSLVPVAPFSTPLGMTRGR